MIIFYFEFSNYFHYPFFHKTIQKYIIKVQLKQIRQRCLEKELYVVTTALSACNSLIGKTMSIIVVTSSVCLIYGGKINLENDITLDRYYPFPCDRVYIMIDISNSIVFIICWTCIWIPMITKLKIILMLNSLMEMVL